MVRLRAALLLFLAAFGLLAAAGGPARAQSERILSFDSAVTVRPDGVLRVEETIEVVAAGREIRRGIFRDFPLRSLTPLGFNHLVGFEILSVERDGEPEPYFLEQLDAGVRIYMGEESVLLSAGRHRYRLVYETSRQLLHRPGEDELYWNVTGDAWAFPIERAAAAVHLPEGLRATGLAAYTGPRGARGGDVEILEDGNPVRLATSRLLAPGEGLTLAVVWPEGAVERPSRSEELLRLLADNRGPVIGFLLLAGLLVYFLVVWHRAGRDPEKGVVIPLFEAPKGLSPVAVGYIWNEGFGIAFDTARALTVALTSLATKGAVTIAEEAEEAFSLARADRVPDYLPAGEKAAFHALFPDGSEGAVTVGDSYEPRMDEAKAALVSAFGSEFRGIYFRRNGMRWVLGAMIAVAAVLCSIAIGPMSEDARILLPVMMLFVSVFLVAGLLLGRRALAGSWFGLGAAPLRRLLRLAFGLACLVPAAGLALFAMQFVAPVALVPASLSVVTATVFWFLLKAPTRLGRQTLDGIEGYRLYLSVAEADRLNAAGREPEITEALFEAHLPYAMALGVEEQWSAKVEARLAASLSDSARGGYRTPRWYRSLDTGGSSRGSLASSLSRSLGGAAATAATRPSSSGSSSSGGFSGGGGGGGGGGGW